MNSFSLESQANYRIPNQLIDLQLQTAASEMNPVSDPSRVMLEPSNRCYPFFGLTQEPQHCQTEAQQLFAQILHLAHQNESDFHILKEFSQKFKLKISDIALKVNNKKSRMYKQIMHYGKVVFYKQSQCFKRINKLKIIYSWKTKPQKEFMQQIRVDLVNFFGTKKQIKKIQQIAKQYENTEANISKIIIKTQQKYYELFFKHIRQNNSDFKQFFQKLNIKGEQFQNYPPNKYFQHHNFSLQQQLHNKLQQSINKQTLNFKKNKIFKNMKQLRKQLRNVIKQVRKLFQQYQQDYLITKQFLMQQGVKILEEYRKDLQQVKFYQQKLKKQQSLIDDQKMYYQQLIIIKQQFLNNKIQKIIILFKNTFINFNNYINKVEQVSAFQAFIKQNIVLSTYFCPWYRILLKNIDCQHNFINSETIIKCWDELLSLLKEKQLPKQISDNPEMWPTTDIQQNQDSMEKIVSDSDSQSIEAEIVLNISNGQYSQSSESSGGKKI